MEPEYQPHEEPHLPAPTLWPIGFAIGVVVALVGLIVNPTLVTPIGAVIAIVFGFLWAREATAELRGHAIHVEPESREMVEAGAGETAPPADQQGVALPAVDPLKVPRSRFLEASTLGLGGVIGALITAPVAGFALLPSFLGQKNTNVDLGPIDTFEQGQWYITTFVSDKTEGAVSRRTAFIRNNGPAPNGEPSFTIISNHCVHLGCPVQANGPADQYIGKQIIHEKTPNGPVIMDPVIPAGYGCPCHGGQYDPEGNRTAGPPVRALDRYDYLIDASSGTPHLVLLGTYSVSHVDGEGSTAKIYRYKEAGPGEHVDGIERFLYPINPPHH